MLVLARIPDKLNLKAPREITEIHLAPLNRMTCLLIGRRDAFLQLFSDQIASVR